MQQPMDRGDRTNRIARVESELPVFHAHRECAAFIHAYDEREQARPSLEAGDNLKQIGMKQKSFVVSVDAAGYNTRGKQ